MKECLAVMKALADASRMRVLCALRDGELCACQLIDLLQLAPSTVSKHLSILQNAGLVESRKEGRWVHYRLPEHPVSGVGGAMTQDLFRSVAGSDQVQADAARVGALRKANLEEICQKIAKRK